MKIKAKSLNFDTAVDNDPLLKVWKWKTYGNNVQQIFKVEISRIKVETPTFKLEKSILKFEKINFKVGTSKFNVGNSNFKVWKNYTKTKAGKSNF